MNLQQVAEGVHSVLSTFPQLLNDQSLGAGSLLTNVENALNAFSLSLMKTEASQYISQTNGKRKNPPTATPETTPLNPAKKAVLTNSGSNTFVPSAADIFVSVGNVQPKRLSENPSYGQVFCEFIAQLLIGSCCPVRPYQYELTVFVVDTFRPIIPHLLTTFSNIAYTPVFPSINFDMDTITYNQMSQANITHDVRIMSARQDALVSTIETFATIVQMESACTSSIFALLTRLPLPLINICPSESTDADRRYRFALSVFSILSSHPRAASFITSHASAHWSSMLSLLDGTAANTRYLTSMALAAFTNLTEADQSTFVRNAMTTSPMDGALSVAVALDHAQHDTAVAHARSSTWATLLKDSVVHTQAGLQTLYHTLSKEHSEDVDACELSLQRWHETVTTDLVNYFATQQHAGSALKPSTGAGVFHHKSVSDVVYLTDIAVPVRVGAPQKMHQVRNDYVQVESADASVKSFAMALNEARPILLEGPAGSGKSLLIDHVARLTRNEDYLRIYMDDQMDSKTLLGTQTCTDVPGEFVWQPGALTQALTQGRWVVLEDIHRVQFEVLASLIPLFEKNMLLVPGRAEVITAAPGFRLIATWTTGTSSLTAVFLRDLLQQRKAVTTIMKDEEDASAPAAVPVATPAACLSQLATQASTATTPAHVLLHRLFTRIILPPITTADIRSIMARKLDKLRSVAGLLDAVIKTARCFAAPATIEDVVGTGAAVLATQEKVEGSDTDSDDDDAEAVGADTKAPSPATPTSEKPLVASLSSQSPFGTACSVSLRHIYRFGDRVQRIIADAPTVRVKRSDDDTDAFQVELTSQLALEIVRAALDCFTAAAVPTHSAHVLARRRAVTMAVASIWQVQPAEVDNMLACYKPNVIITDHEVRINQFNLARNKVKSLQLLNDPHFSKFSLTRHALLNMEKIFAAICAADPLLLVGETGNGKTTIVQYLAAQLGQVLHVHNMNQQSEASDLLGGFKPVQLRVACIPLMNEFGQIFPKTFSRDANKDFLLQIKRAFDEKNWKLLVHFFKQTLKNVHTKLRAQVSADGATVMKDPLKARWVQFAHDVTVFERRVQQTSSFAFWFAEGSLIKAIRDGDWILLDEVNLASAETLDRLASLLEDNKGSIALTERGDVEVIQRHPNFRLFACMNPATDAGKKDLPLHIRDRFCELYVADIDEEHDLHLIVSETLGTDTAAHLNVTHLVHWFLHVKALCKTVLFDGAGHHPHYSPRSLVRALRFAKKHASHYGTYRALYEGISLSFASPLSADSRLLVDALLWQYIFVHIYQNAIGSKLPSASIARGSVPPVDTQLDARSKLLGLLNQYTAKAIPKAIQAGSIVIGPHALQPGPYPIVEKARETFIITPTVEARLGDVARAIVSRLPVLLQGPTSAGKTSLVTYLADVTGNKCVRINNHLHTDVQEYIGAYVTDSDGNLTFQEGILVTAVRNGYWIILDELNLAPSEVLESLNRLLDDNNEIFIAETQETVRAHPNFLLFATQNPPGLYGGRKVLSRAFTNRFVQLHCDDLPEEELITILERRCKIPPSYAEKMVAIMKDLQLRRQSSLSGGVFSGKRALLTPRDLFRWADRKPVNIKKLAEDGFLLLGERLRNEEGKAVVKEVLEKHCNCTIDLVEIYTSSDIPILDSRGRTGVSDDERQARRAREDDEERLRLLQGGGKLLRKQRKAEKEKEKKMRCAMSDVEAAVDKSFELTEEELAMERVVQEELAKIGTVAWTFSMRRLFTLVYRCVQHDEPVLLVGATGAGKTTVCQILAIVLRRKLDIINCHQHTETSDFLGGLRPVRGKDRILASLVAAITATVPRTDALRALATRVLNAFAETAMTEDDSCDTKLLIAVRSLCGAITALPVVPDTDGLAGPQAAAELVPWMEATKGIVAKALKASRRLAKTMSVGSEVTGADVYDPSIVDYAAAAAQLGVSDGTLLHQLVADTMALEVALMDHQPLLQSFNALFEWKDGVLVTAMKQGNILLLDEISLADDAVLERLNSVLESSRTLFLAEKGGQQVESIVAHPKFAIVATMNPGGDFGKKELSPALRNRFTEIWVPQLDSREDLLNIISERFMQPVKKPSINDVPLDAVALERRSRVLTQLAAKFAPLLLDFIEYFNGLKLHRRQFSLRDVLAWVGFMTHLFLQDTGADESDDLNVLARRMEHCYVHAASLVILDGLAVGASDGDSETNLAKTRDCMEFLVAQLPEASRQRALDILTYNATEAMVPQTLPPPADPVHALRAPHGLFGIEPFYIPRGAQPAPITLPFAVEATSTRINLTRVLRALQLPRAVLLEGSPGVGKTSLIAALAKMSGHRLVRINLSEQTDMLDLLGSDLPVHGGEGGQFMWCDGVFLQALKAGDWVLLDELNLASQSVLEGLNAVLDHRAQIYLPELDQTFNCPPTFRLFAAQNPVAQGGGRKGLPASFLNRFTKVWLHAMTTEDLFNITQRLYPDIPEAYLSLMITFNEQVHKDTMTDRLYGRTGAPWEFNLRDVFRWCDLVRHSARDVACVLAPGSTDDAHALVPHGDDPDYGLGNAIRHPGAFLDIMYLQRMRTETDRTTLQMRFDEICRKAKANSAVVGYQRHDIVPSVEITPTVFRIGTAWLPRLPNRFGHTTPGSTANTSYNLLTFAGVKALAATVLGSSTADNCLLLHQLLRPLEHLARCVSRAWPVILNGEAGTGKTSLIRMLARATNNELHEIAMSSSADSTDLLGCFEQVDWDRHRAVVIGQSEQLASYLTTSLLVEMPRVAKDSDHALVFQKVVSTWDTFQRLNGLEVLMASGKAEDALSDADKISSSQRTATVAPCFKENTFHALIAFYDAAEQAYMFVNRLHATVSSHACNLLACLQLPKHLTPAALRQQADTFQHNTVSAKLAVGRFEWIDGTLLQALERGHWIVLDNANFCNPTVLDRLNGLLEPAGTLLVNECGLVDGQPRIVTPHPNFRIFLTIDPQFGEISRAMRNRCVEITLTHPIGSPDVAVRAHHLLAGLAVNPAGMASLADPARMFSVAALVKDVEERVVCVPRADTTPLHSHPDTLFVELAGSNVHVHSEATPATPPIPATLTFDDVFSVDALRDLIAVTAARGIPGIALNTFFAQVHTAMLFYPAFLASATQFASLQYQSTAPLATPCIASSRHRVWTIRNLTRWAALVVSLVTQSSELAAAKSAPVEDIRHILWRALFHAYTLSRFTNHHALHRYVANVFAFFYASTIVGVTREVVSAPPGSTSIDPDLLLLAPAIFPQNVVPATLTPFPRLAIVEAIRRQLAVVEYLVMLAIADAPSRTSPLGSLLRDLSASHRRAQDAGHIEMQALSLAPRAAAPVDDVRLSAALSIPRALHPLLNAVAHSHNNSRPAAHKHVTVVDVLVSALERFVLKASMADADARQGALDKLERLLTGAMEQSRTYGTHATVMRVLQRVLAAAKATLAAMFAPSVKESGASAQAQAPSLHLITHTIVAMRQVVAGAAQLDMRYLHDQPLDMLETWRCSPTSAVTAAPTASALALLCARVHLLMRSPVGSVAASAAQAAELTTPMLLLQHVLAHRVQVALRRHVEAQLEDDCISYLLTLGSPLPAAARNALYPLAASLACLRNLIPVHSIDSTPFTIALYPALASLSDALTLLSGFLGGYVTLFPAFFAAANTSGRTMAIVMQLYLLHTLRAQFFSELWSSSAATGSLAHTPYMWNYGSLLVRWRGLVSSFNAVVRSVQQYIHRLPNAVDAPPSPFVDTTQQHTLFGLCNKDKLANTLAQCEHALIRASQALMTQSGGNSNLHMLVGQPPLGRQHSLLVPSGPAFASLHAVIRELSDAVAVVSVQHQHVKPLRFFDSSVDPATMVAAAGHNAYSTYGAVSSPFQPTSALWLPPHFHWALPAQFKDSLVELISNAQFARSPLLFKTVAKVIAQQLSIEESAAEKQSLIATVLGKKRSLAESRSSREHKFIRAFLTTLHGVPRKLHERMAKYLINAMLTKRAISTGKTQIGDTSLVPEYAFLAPLEDATTVQLWGSLRRSVSSVFCTSELLLQRPHLAEVRTVKQAFATHVFRARRAAQILLEYVGATDPVPTPRAHIAQTETIYDSFDQEAERTRARATVSPADMACFKSVLNMLAPLDGCAITFDMDGVTEDLVMALSTANVSLEARFNEFLWNNSLVSPLFTRYKVRPDGNVSASSVDVDALREQSVASVPVPLANDAEHRIVFPQFSGLGSAAITLAINVLAFKNLPGRSNGTSISKRNLRIKQLGSVVEHLLLSSTALRNASTMRPTLPTPLAIAGAQSQYVLVSSQADDVVAGLAALLVKLLPAYQGASKDTLVNFTNALLGLTATESVELPAKMSLINSLRSSTHPLVVTLFELLEPMVEVFYSHMVVEVNIANSVSVPSTCAWQAMLWLLIGLVNLRIAVPVAPVDPSQVSQYQGKQADSIATAVRVQLAVRQWGLDVEANAPSGLVDSMPLTAEASPLFDSSADLADIDASALLANIPADAVLCSTNAALAHVMVGQSVRAAQLSKQLTYRAPAAKSFAVLFELLHKFTTNGVDAMRTVQLGHAMVTFISSAPAIFAQASQADEQGLTSTHVPIQHAQQMLREECVIQDLSQSFLKSLKQEFHHDYPDICVSVDSAVYTIKTALRDMAALVSNAVSAETLALTHEQVITTNGPADQVVVVPETTRTIAGTLYSLLAFPCPMLPATLAPQPGASEDGQVDLLADPLLYLLSGRVTAAVQALGDVAESIARAKTRAAAERRATKQRQLEQEQAELRKRVGDAYGEDIVSANPFGDGDGQDWTSAQSEADASTAMTALAATELGGDDGFDGIGSDDEDNDEAVAEDQQHNFKQLPLLVYRAVLLRFLVAGLTDASGPISAKSTAVDHQGVAAMSPKVARLISLIFHRVLAAHRKKLLLERRRAEAEKEVFRVKNSDVEVLSEEEQLEVELRDMYPDFSDVYVDIMKMNDQFNTDDLNGDDDRIKAALDAQRKQEQLATAATMVDEDVTSTFLAFKLLFACAQSAVSVGDIHPCPDLTMLRDAVNTLRSLAISATQTAAAAMLAALETTQATHALCTTEVDSAALPGLLYSMSTAYLFLAQHASLSGVAHSLANAHASAATSAALSSACAADIVVTLGGLCATLCPALSPMPPVDTSNKKLSWKSMTVDNANARAGTDQDVKLIYHDVWRHPNMAEVQRLVGPLRAYQNRIRYLLTLFPSHPILRQLALLAARLAAQPLNSPIMKVLTGCECLLKKSEEWEAHAHRGVKLKDELFQITVLVARWRKLELHSWPMALKRKDDEYEAAAIPWWCRLYPIIHCTPQDLLTYAAVADTNTHKSTASRSKEGKDSSYDNYFLQLHTALQEFIVYSNLGEIKARLAILLAFRNQIDREIHGGFAEIAYQEGTRLPVSVRMQVMNLLEHVFRQYVQFLPAVMKHLADEKLPLERVIVEQVKLSVWDLSNYWALKDSTEKSHRRVHKLASDYEVLLKTPFSAVLQKVAAEDVSHQGAGAPPMGVVYKVYAQAKAAAKAMAARLRRVAGKPEKKKKKKLAKAEAEPTNENGAVVAPVEVEDESDDEEAELTTAAALAKRTSADVAQMLTGGDVKSLQVVPGLETTAQITLGAVTMPLQHMTASVFIAPAAQWLPFLMAQDQQLSAAEDNTLRQLPMLFGRMLTLLRRSLLSASNAAADASALSILDEMTFATIQRVEGLTHGDGAPIQTKKMAVTDTLKLLRLLGLSFHSSAAGMLALADNATLGSLQVHQAQDMDVFSASALPQQPGTNGIEGDATSTQHDIHTASLSLLSSSASARGINKLDDRADALLNILSASFQEMNEHTDEIFDTEEVETAGSGQTRLTKRPRQVFRALASSGQNTTRVVPLPLWFLQSSLSAAFTEDAATAIPRLLEPPSTALIPNVAGVPPSLAALTASLAKHCDEAVHDAYTGLRKMRTRASTSSQKDVNRGQIVKLQGMMEHLFTLCSSSLAEVAGVATHMHALRQWLLSLTLFTKTVHAPATPASPTLSSATAPCSVEHLAVVVRGLLECAEAELVLLQRLQTVTRHRAPLCTAITRKIAELCADVPLDPATIVTAAQQAMAELELSAGPLMALRQLHRQLSALLAFIRPQHLRSRDDKHAWLLMIQKNVDMCVAQVAKALPAIVGHDRATSIAILPFTSFASNPLLGRSAKTARARMGIPGPTSPWLTLCAEACYIAQRATQPHEPPAVLLEALPSTEHTQRVITHITTSILVLVQEAYHAASRRMKEARERDIAPKVQAELEETQPVEEPWVEASMDSIENLVLDQLSSSDSRLQKAAIVRVLKRLSAAAEHHAALTAALAAQQATGADDRITALRAQVDLIQSGLALVTPFLHQLYLTCHRQVIVCLGAARGGLRLLQVLLSVFNVILVKGLCKRADEEDGEDEGDEGQAESGTGMGEGAGGKDVSDELTDEQQLLGTKNERTEDQTQDPQEQDTETGMEMSNEFDGDMVDVPQEEQEERDKDSGEQEHDREMGDLDDDEQNVVDERLWNPNEDNEEEIDRSQEKREEGEAGGGEEDGKETVAGDDEQDESKDDKKKDKKAQEDKKQKESEEKEHEKEEPQMEEAKEDVDEREDDLGQVNMDDPSREEEDTGITPSDLPDDVSMDEKNMDDELPQEDNGDDEEEGEDAKENAEDDAASTEEQGALESDMKDADSDGARDEGEPDEGGDMDPAEEEQDQNMEDDTRDEESLRDESNQEEREELPDDSVAALPDDSQEKEEAEQEEHDEVDREDQAAEDQAQQAAQGADADLGQVGGQDTQGQDKDKQSKNQHQQQSADAEKQTMDAMDQEQQETKPDSDSSAQQSSTGEASAYQSQEQKVHASAPEKKKEQKEQKAQKLDNPYASLGDALKKWRERMDILETEDAVGKEKVNPNLDEDEQGERDVADDFDHDKEMSGTVEHANKNEAADAQVMAAVDEEQDKDLLPKLPQEQSVEESHQEGEVDVDAQGESANPLEDEAENATKDAGADADGEERATAEEDTKVKKNDKRPADSTLKKELQEETAVDDDDGLDDLIAEFEEEYDPLQDALDAGAAMHLPPPAHTDDLSDARETSMEENQDKQAELSAEQIAEMREELDRDLDSFNSGELQGGVSRMDRASKLWQTLTTVTSDLAQQLCEQLRIILEPSLASKLAGDFRTGKRINIKKIIPFIASQFRRDKIWLRRTAPNKRNYQVLIAIDDSGSMRSNKAGRVALESLAVLCQALTQLEVGEISVVSFGDKPRLLHPFQKPFTPETGAYVVSGFEFNQRQTQWTGLLQRVTTILDHARGDSANSETENLQLVFLISDARIQQDRDLVAKLAREALEKRQLLCLLIIDTEDDKKSILSVKKVSTIKGGLKVTSYLEDFPFPYYTILRDIQALPETVADALREWFELVQRAN